MSTYQLAQDITCRIIVEWNKHPPHFRVIADGFVKGYHSKESAIRAAKRLCKKHGLTLTMANEFKDILDILAKANGAVLYWQMPKGAKAALDAGVVTIDDNDLMVHPNAIGPDENGQYTMPISD